MPQPSHIVKIALPNHNDLDPDIQKYLSICVDKLGMAPNVLTTYTGSPQKFQNFS